MISDYESWRTWVFDHSDADSDQQLRCSNHHSLEFDPEQHLETGLRWITKLFEEARLLPSKFSADQIGQGLWFLVDPSASSHMFNLTHPDLVFSNRARGISSIVSLYRDLFDPLCGQNEESKKLDDICSVFWDVAPFSPTGSTLAPTEQDRAFLEVLENISKFDNPVCRKSILNAMDFWSAAYPARINALSSRLR